MELTIEHLLQQGVAAHREDKLEKAERLYRTILQSQPLHPDANEPSLLIKLMPHYRYSKSLLKPTLR